MSDGRNHSLLLLFFNDFFYSDLIAIVMKKKVTGRKFNNFSIKSHVTHQFMNN